MLLYRYNIQMQKITIPEHFSFAIKDNLINRNFVLIICFFLDFIRNNNKLKYLSFYIMFSVEIGTDFRISVPKLFFYINQL